MIRSNVVAAATLFASFLTMQANPQAAAPPAASAPPQATTTPIEDPFRLGLMVEDTNGDKIADAICGHILLSKSPSAAENTAAANLAARLGFETTALSLPIVLAAPASMPKAPAGCQQPVNLWIGSKANNLPANSPIESSLAALQIGEGGVFVTPGGLLIAGSDEAGLLVAANAYSAHAPYQWSVSADKLEAIARTINTRLKDQKLTASATLIGLTYQGSQTGIHRAIVEITGSIDRVAIQAALAPTEGESPLHNLAIRELEIRFATTGPLTLAVAGRPVPPASTPASPAAAPGEEARLLDLRDLYGIKGLLTGTPKKLVPESVAAKLYVPAGEPGTAMANLAARLGLETTGITLPIAFPAIGVTPAQIQTPAVITGSTPLTSHVADLLGAPANTPLDKILPDQFGSATTPELPGLKPGQGELHIVDRAFGINPALLVRGDQAGSAAALDYASLNLPYLWEPDKKFEGLSEMRLDLQNFLSHRSTAGQVTTALYDLDKWSSELITQAAGKHFTSVTAEIDVDESDPKLKRFVEDQLQARLKPQHLEVTTGTLHAGTKCCDAAPDLHNNSLVIPFHQAEPTFRDDFTIPWEGKRLLEAVTKGRCQSHSQAARLARSSCQRRPRRAPQAQAAAY